MGMKAESKDICKTSHLWIGWTMPKELFLKAIKKREDPVALSF